ncbi:MAG: TIGR00296 family protein [Candidatus Helarchaeota archaeon]
MPFLTDEEGKMLLRLARRVVEKAVHEGRPVSVNVPEDFTDKLKTVEAGVFVTLRKHEGREKQLRGCIGRITGVKLAQATIDSAIDSPLHDPRFPTVRPGELNNITVEISVLTPPELVKVDDVEDYPKKIKVGRDGLIIQQGLSRGLLLPQVPVEQDPPWTEKEFLEWTCWKAHLPRNAWRDPATEIYRFEAEIFEELEPNGEIIRKTIND